MQEMLAEIRDGPDPQRYRTVELQHLQKDRKKLWCEVTTKFLRDKELRVQGVVGISRSIQDRKKAEDTLQSSEARLRQLLENMPDLVIMTDTKGSIQYINRAHVDKSAKDLVGTDCLQCIRPDFHAQCRQLFERAVETQRAQSHEVVDVCGKIWSCRVTPIVARDSVCSLMIISTDITERKYTEEKLRDSEERFQNLAQAVDDVVWTMSLDGSQMLYINPAAERVYGRPCKEFYDNPRLWIEVVLPEDREQAAVGAKELKERGWKQGEYRIVRPDGEVRWLYDRARVICNRDGKPTHIGGLASDITERKVAERALLKEHGRLRRLLDMHERDRQLVAFEIHDGLAQPITAALMQLEASLRDLGEEYPQTALQRCEDGLALLRASMHEARRLMGGLRPSVLDEFGVVSAINNLIADSCSDDGPEIEYEHKVEFDRLAVPLETAVFRIAQEGLANALEHSQSDRIRVRLVQKGRQLRIEVRDWGVGFDPKAVEPNRFGLEGIRERARLFGGEATIDTFLGRGTSVTVDLPAIKPASST
jgi:PAS domain S-box-containing protein